MRTKSVNIDFTSTTVQPFTSLISTLHHFLISRNKITYPVEPEHRIAATEARDEKSMIWAFLFLPILPLKWV